VTGELRALTGARGLAAWFVVLFHLRAALGVPDSVRTVLAKGYLAVDFFFLLSGFVIWLNYADRITNQRRSAIPMFLWRRIARIWPLHLVMLAFALVITLVLDLSGRPADPRFPLEALPLHILLLQNWPIVQGWFGRTSLDWNDPAWSISSEMFAYLIFPLLVMAVDWKKTSTPILLGAIVAFLTILAVVMIPRGMIALGQAIPSFGQLRCVTEFAAGTAVGALWLRFRDRPVVPGMAAAAVATLALAAFRTGLAGEIVSLPIALAGVLLMLALTSNTPGNPLSHRVIHYLGEISFATYLSHSLLWKAFSLVAVHDAGPVPPGRMIAFLGLVLVVSIALYHLVERPAQRWINQTRRHPDKRQDPEPRAPAAAALDPGSSAG
jgi:peptidoglycan/LPS O-acetylase OafA/YrhL